MDRTTVPVVQFSFFEKLLENFNWVRKFVQEEMNLGWVLWSDPIEPIQPKQRSPKFFYFLPVIYIYIYYYYNYKCTFYKTNPCPLGLMARVAETERTSSPNGLENREEEEAQQQLGACPKLLFDLFRLSTCIIIVR